MVGDLNCCRETIDSAYAQDDPVRDQKFCKLYLTKSQFCFQAHAKDKDKTSVDWLSRFIVSEPLTDTSLTEPLQVDRASSHHAPSPSSTCLVDTFRLLHRTQEHAYTCWSTLLDCRKTNFGTRIDYILCSTRLAPHVAEAEVWQHVMGSDHCPVFAEFDLCLFSPPNHPLPSLCSDLFTSKQSSLFSFLKPKPKDTVDERDSHIKSASKEITSSSGIGAKRPQLSSLARPAKQAKGATQQATSLPREGEDLSGGRAKGDTLRKKPVLNESWKAIFKPKPKAPPPLCKGHDEPCVLRKVKKAGPNKDREFWVCARPVGGKNDPQARCDYFKWASK